MGASVRIWFNDGRVSPPPDSGASDTYHLPDSGTICLYWHINISTVGCPNLRLYLTACAVLALTQGKAKESLANPDRGWRLRLPRL